ncbi:serine hydrolase domain-containing protein [Temperatibacter marinus]|uniref:Serine hydrolase domain-containing protein n=1 Tax=Temperatibacter marinus TaxID=1456591 RepID=A0AA52EGD7_9PROT|nr:serine hydrolase domain-containing protein [Temperatibacter marinus]WND02643.1 serine hydrolase domain-containing protein [Temperatibacter marinus]
MKSLCKLLVLTLTSLWVFPSALQANDKPIEKIHSPTLTTTDKKLDRITEHFNAYINQGKMAGAISLVTRKGKIIHYEKMGQQNMAQNRPMQDDTIFRIYSMTKPIIGAGLMMLWEDGKFKLDDPVSKYIPEFKNLKVYAGQNDDGSMKTVDMEREMTVRDLLTHTAGLSYGWFSETPVDMLYRSSELLAPHLSTKEFISRLSKIPLLVQPGSRWIYSVSVDVQGYLIEVLSGMPLDQYLREKIFNPLGMKDTGFHVPEANLDRFVEVYTLDKDKGLIPLPAGTIQDFTKKPAFHSGGGGLVSTTFDYLAFAKMILNKGSHKGKKLLSPETVDLMGQNHLPKGVYANPEKTMGFGLGLAVLEGLPADGSKGSNGELNWGGMANTVFWIDPQEDLIAIFMTNMLPFGLLPFREEFKARIYPLN